MNLESGRKKANREAERDQIFMDMMTQLFAVVRAQPPPSLPPTGQPPAPPFAYPSVPPIPGPSNYPIPFLYNCPPPTPTSDEED